MLNFWLPGTPYHIFHIKVHLPSIRRKGQLRTLTRAAVLWYAEKTVCCSHISWLLHDLEGKAGQDALTHEEYLLHLVFAFIATDWKDI